MERTKWLGKWLLSWMVYLIVFSVVGLLFPISAEIMAAISPADSRYTMLALIVVTLCVSFLFNYVISNSRITGFRLLGAMLVLTWGIQSFMTQVETLVFIKAFPQLKAENLVSMMVSSFLVYLLALPFSMLLHGKWKKVQDFSEDAPCLKKRWYFWLPLISALYVILYFSFGLFPISFPEVKEFYATWISAQNNMSGVGLAIIQVVRGLLWFACLLPLFLILNGSKEKKMVIAALVMGVITAFQLMYPNGLMPPIVRFGHFVEVFSEMMIFGALIAWMVVPEDKKV